MIAQPATLFDRQPGLLTLDPGEVHLWAVRLADLAPAEVRARGALAPDELERAARFHFEADRRRFVLARALLRALLARYLAVEPAALAFVYGLWGKPALAAQPMPHDLQFNLSHAGDLALYAFARGRAVGVDVERCDPALNPLSFAGHFLAPGEVRALASCSPAQRMALFFAYWTRKEALIKAHGAGMALPLARIDLSAAAGPQPQGAEWPLQAALPDGPTPYFVRDLPLGPGYAASCAVAGPEPPGGLRLVPAAVG